MRESAGTVDLKEHFPDGDQAPRRSGWNTCYNSLGGIGQDPRRESIEADPSCVGADGVPGLSVRGS